MIVESGFPPRTETQRGRPKEDGDKVYFSERREVAAVSVSRGELFLRPLPLPALTATEHINQLSPFINPANESLRRPSVRASNVARPPKNFLRPLRNCVENAPNGVLGGRQDISALFRTEAANQSQSRFITNLDFQTLFGRDRRGRVEKGV